MKTELEIKVEAALTEIRPFLQNDGGDIELISVENDTAKVMLKGACNSCSFNQMTFINGVETTIKKFAPEIKQVINVTNPFE
jgi:Fe-S cluster biogenesis protein NfuA